MNNTRAFKTNELKALSIETVEQIITEFNIDTHTHVNDKIIDPVGGEVYIFYTTDPAKYLDYRVDGFKWKNMGGNKPFPAKNTIFLKSYYV